jgi:tetratricopeptide (TPR) repeat protein
MAHIERALELAPVGHPERAGALTLFGEAAFHGGRYVEAAAALEEAIAAFRGAGEIIEASSAMVTLGNVDRLLGNARQWTLPVETLELLEPLGPSRHMVAALTEVAANGALRSDYEPAIRNARRAIEMASELGLPKPARALGYLALALGESGDASAIGLYEEAIRLAIEAGQGREVALLHNNFGIMLISLEGPSAALEVMREGVRFAEGIGNTEMVNSLHGSEAFTLTDAGRPGEAIALSDSIEEWLVSAGDMFDLQASRIASTRALVLMGRADRAADIVGFIEERGRQSGDLESLTGGLGAAALARAALGEDRAAIELLRELVHAREGVDAYFLCMAPAFVREAVRLGGRELADTLADASGPLTPLRTHTKVATDAILLEADGDLEGAEASYADAAAGWEAFTVVPEHAFALLGQGRCLVELGREVEAGSVLRDAHRIFEDIGAMPALSETDELLQRSIARTS